MEAPYYVNFFMPELVAGEALPLLVQAAGEDADQDAVTRQKGYPAYHAMLSTDGSGRLETSLGSYDVPSGHVFLLAPDQPHSYHPASARWHTRWVVFHGAGASEIVARLGLAMGTPFALSDSAIFTRIYQSICACAQENKLKGIYAASAFCYQLLTALSFEACNPGNGTASEAAHSRVAPVLEYIHAHYASDIGLGQMADCIGVSPQHLCKLFQSLLAMSPCEYLQRHRMKKAKELLIDKDLPARAIGSLCGFQDPSYFSMIFKKQVGYTPKEFRMLFKGA